MLAVGVVIGCEGVEVSDSIVQLEKFLSAERQHAGGHYDRVADPVLAQLAVRGALAFGPP